MDVYSEVIKVTKITPDNFEMIKILAVCNQISESSVQIGQFLVSLTTRVKSLFTNYIDYNIINTTYWIVNEHEVFRSFILIGEPTGIIKSYDAKRKTDSTISQNNDVKDTVMSQTPLTMSYVLFMVDNHGSRTYQTLMDYGRAPEEIVEAFEAAYKEGYLEHGKYAKQPYLTDDGRDHMRFYYGNGIECYD